MSDVNWAEKRDALRQRTFKRGRIVVNNISTTDCVIRNMSLTGARLAVPNTLSLPDEFELVIGDEGLRRTCEVMSRSETSAGVRFHEPLSSRELGAEFMSAKRSATTQGEPNGAPRATVGAPPLEGAAPSAHKSDAETGISKLRPAALPRKLRANLPW